MEKYVKFVKSTTHTSRYIVLLVERRYQMYKCDNCEKPAVIHFQTCEVRWHIIDNEIDLSSQEFLSGEDSQYFCKECAEKEGYI